MTMIYLQFEPNRNNIMNNI